MTQNKSAKEDSSWDRSADADMKNASGGEHDEYKIKDRDHNEDRKIVSDKDTTPVVVVAAVTPWSHYRTDASDGFAIKRSYDHMISIMIIKMMGKYGFEEWGLGKFKDFYEAVQSPWSPRRSFMLAERTTIHGGEEINDEEDECGYKSTTEKQR